MKKRTSQKKSQVRPLGKWQTQIKAASKRKIKKMTDFKKLINIEPHFGLSKKAILKKIRMKKGKKKPQINFKSGKPEIQ